MGCWISWGAFKTTLLDRFFSLELRERKLQEFIKLLQGVMSVKEYSLKFTQLSKYATTIVGVSKMICYGGIQPCGE